MPSGIDKNTILDDDEIIKEVEIPEPAAGIKCAFTKFALRKSIDFPVLNCAAAIESAGGKVKSARICLNSVYGRADKGHRGRAADQRQEGNRSDGRRSGQGGVSRGFPAAKQRIQDLCCQDAGEESNPGLRWTGGVIFYHCYLRTIKDDLKAGRRPARPILTSSI